MKKRQGNLRRIIDIGMTVLLILQMAYQVMGEAAHEWLGMHSISYTFMLSCFCF